jgi:hypothetical protein
MLVALYVENYEHTLQRFTVEVQDLRAARRIG